jgi:hypothetical protein
VALPKIPRHPHRAGSFRFIVAENVSFRFSAGRGVLFCSSSSTHFVEKTDVFCYGTLLLVTRFVAENVSFRLSAGRGARFCSSASAHFLGDDSRLLLLASRVCCDDLANLPKFLPIPFLQGV